MLIAGSHFNVCCFTICICDTLLTPTPKIRPMRLPTFTHNHTRNNEHLHLCTPSPSTPPFPIQTPHTPATHNTCSHTQQIHTPKHTNVHTHLRCTTSVPQASKCGTPARLASSFSSTPSPLAACDAPPASNTGLPCVAGAAAAAATTDADVLCLACVWIGPS